MNQFDDFYLQVKERFYDSSIQIKKDIVKKNFINFFLKETKKINEWNNKNNLLKFTPFNRG